MATACRVGDTRGQLGLDMSAERINQSSEDEGMLRSPAAGPKYCRVCGDKAYNVNFNVISCESCKAFFRRNALNPRELHCTFNGHCEINMVTRRKCKKCRLEKCFKVGMVKEFIMNEEARIRRRFLTEQNRAKRRTALEKTVPRKGHTETQQVDTVRQSDLQFSDMDTSPASGQCSAKVRPDTGSSCCDQIAESCSDTIAVPKSVLAALIKRCHQTSYSGYTPLQFDGAGRKSEDVAEACLCRFQFGAVQQCPDTTICSSSSTCSSSDQREIESVGTQRHHVQPEDKQRHKGLMKILCAEIGVDFPSNGGHVMKFDFGLSASKSAHFDCLRLAYEVMYDRLNDSFARQQSMSFFGYGDHCERTPTALLLPISVYMERVDNIIRRLVRFCRRTVALKHLDPMDQINLIKGSMADLMLLRGVQAYVPALDAWRHTDPLGPHSSITVLKAKGVYNEYTKFATDFQRRYLRDENIFLSIFALVLFDPDRPRIVDRDSVRVVRAFYTNVLYQYLLTSCGSDIIAKNKLRDISCVLSNVKIASQTFVWKMVVEMYPDEPEPLLIDIFEYDQLRHVDYRNSVYDCVSLCTLR